MWRRLTGLALAAAALLVALWFFVQRDSSRRSPAAHERAAEPQVRTELQPAAVESGTAAEAARSRVENQPAAAVDPAAGGSAAIGAQILVHVGDERQLPIPGTSVELLFPENGVFRATSGADGIARFSVPYPEHAEVGLARGRDATRASIEDCRLPARADRPQHDVVELYLVFRPTHALDVLATRDGKAVPGVSIAAEGHGITELARITSDAQGRAHFEGLPEDWIVFHAETADADGTTSVIVPDPTRSTVEIRLEPLRTLLVRVREKKTGQPIAGARVSLRDVLEQPQLPYRELLGAARKPREGPATDDAGLSRIEGVPVRPTLVVTAERMEGTQVVDRVQSKVGPADTEVMCEFYPSTPRTLRWPVVAGELPVPPEDAVIEAKENVPGFLPLRRARMENGELVVESTGRQPIFWFRGPDGCLAAGAGDFKPISFQRPRKLSVVVRRADGSPAQDLQVTTSGWTFDGSALARTDPQGHATIDGLFPRSVEVRVGEDEQLAGTVDLATGDGTLEFQLSLPHRILVHPRIAGVPQLPSCYWVWTTPQPSRFVKQAPERAEVELECLAAAGSTVSIAFRSTGFQYAEKEVEIAPDGQTTELDLDLQPAFAVHATVAHDRPQKKSILLQRASEDHGWKEAGDDELSLPNAAGDVYAFEGLGPGRYRIEESSSGQFSDEVEIGPANPVGQVHLDLAQTMHIAGRVEGPADLDPSLVRVVLTGDELERRECPLAKDRSFALEVPLGRRAFLSATHPFLASADPEPVVAADGAVLHLKEGDEVQLALASLIASGFRPGVHVLRFAGEPAENPLSSHQAVLSGDVARFGGVPPGRWTLWIDVGGNYAPLVLRDVEIGSGVTKLPEPRFMHGSTLRVRMLVGAGKPFPRLFARATFLGAPRFARGARTNRGDPLLELPGLAAGTYEVTLSSELDFAGEDQPRRLDVDGQTDVEWTLDLR